MAEKRMFSNSVVMTDSFLDLPTSTRALYLSYGMLADDDGFVQSPKSILRQSGCSDDDLRILISKGYAIAFDSGVIVLTHFKVNNVLKSDRAKPTICINEMQQLKQLSNKQYVLRDNQIESGMEPTWSQPGTKTDTECTRSIEKGSLVNNIIDYSTSSCDDADVDADSFSIPSIDDVVNYAKSIGYTNLDAEQFIDYYSSRGWEHSPGVKVNWRKSIKKWKRNERKGNGRSNEHDRNQQNIGGSEEKFKSMRILN